MHRKLLTTNVQTLSRFEIIVPHVDYDLQCAQKGKQLGVTRITSCCIRTAPVINTTITFPTFETMHVIYPSWAVPSSAAIDNNIFLKVSAVTAIARTVQCGTFLRAGTNLTAGGGRNSVKVDGRSRCETWSPVPRMYGG